MIILYIYIYTHIYIYMYTHKEKRILIQWTFPCRGSFGEHPHAKGGSCLTRVAPELVNGASGGVPRASPSSAIPDIKVAPSWVFVL